MAPKRCTKEWVLAQLREPLYKKPKVSSHSVAEPLMDKLDYALNRNIASFFPGVCKVGRYAFFDHFTNLKGKPFAVPSKSLCNDEQEWEVSSIIGHQLYEDGDCDFLIIWMETDPLFPGFNTSDLPFTPMISVLTLGQATQDIPDMVNAYYFNMSWTFMQENPTFVDPIYREYTNYFS